MDIVSAAKRTEMMSGIRGKNTRPEMLVRSSLHRMGFRYRLHAKELPGKPDVVFPKYKAVIFVNGCFWHGHNCALFKLPSTRTEFWEKKIARTRERDVEQIDSITTSGWRVLTIWECALRGRSEAAIEVVIGQAANWLIKGSEIAELRG